MSKIFYKPVTPLCKYGQWSYWSVSVFRLAVFGTNQTESQFFLWRSQSGLGTDVGPHTGLHIKVLYWTTGEHQLFGFSGILILEEYRLLGFSGMSIPEECQIPWISETPIQYWR
ncbi:hypothetical protein RCL_jg29493.t1 [Rhizophagus clarus]|uniref:Uncharacterized protein n=1 Tax=Rhizophagus clarus TaxID=94130 RepID=A0A8H3QEM7_9GLOM|nr:hypothetical protein RCL_jg29493.t1 [Rhizophagus clarus]